MTNRTCEIYGCDVELHRKVSKGRWPKYCDEHKVSQKKAYGAGSRTKICNVPNCGRLVRARGVCSMHHKRLLRAEGKMQEEWDDRRRENYHRRLGRLQHPGAERINPLEVAKRDQWICGICGTDVDGSLEYPDPKSKTTDHIIPLSRGGLHVSINTQLAHLECNVRKGNRVDAKASEMLA